MGSFYTSGDETAIPSSSAKGLDDAVKLRRVGGAIHCGIGSRRNGGLPTGDANKEFDCDTPFALFLLQFAKKIRGAVSNVKSKPCSNQISCFS
jgi:hypothetical protein